MTSTSTKFQFGVIFLLSLDRLVGKDVRLIRKDSIEILRQRIKNYSSSTEPNSSTDLNFDANIRTSYQQRLTPTTAEHLQFLNCVPTAIGPDSEFGLHREARGAPIHRLENKLYQASLINQWIRLANLSSSWRSNENSKKHVVKWSENIWDDLFAEGTMLWHLANVPSLSGTLCKMGLEETSGTIPLLETEVRKTSWWTGKTTLFSLTRELFCGTSQNHSDTKPSSRISWLYRYHANDTYVSEPLSEVVIQDRTVKLLQEEVREPDITLFQTSFFHDSLRIKVDIESQFVFALVFVWVLHYLYLVIVVYVLRDHERFPGGQRRMRQRGYETSYLNRLPLPSQRPSANSFDHDWHIEDDATCATDSTLAEHDQTRTDKVHVLSGKNASDLHSHGSDHHNVSSEASIVETRQLPRFINIQPSYLDALCMLDSDADDSSHAALY